MANKKTSVVVLTTNVPNEVCVIRANPTNAEVRSFVKEHHRRFLTGEPAGPSGEHRAYQIRSATRYDSEFSYMAGDEGNPVKIEDIIKPRSA